MPGWAKNRRERKMPNEEHFSLEGRNRTAERKHEKHQQISVKKEENKWRKRLKENSRLSVRST